MNLQRKPRLGVLALMLEGYEPLFPGITRRQTDYVHALLEHLAPAAEFIFPGPAVNAGDMARLVGRYNAEGADGILILLLSYAQGQYLAHALRENCLPLALALVQPDESVGVDFGELELTVNQGIHGSQDCANALLRAGIPCEFYAGPRADGQLLTFVSDFAAAAATARDMRSMRIGVIGRLAGMGDVVTDDMAVYRQLGRSLSTTPSARCTAAAPPSAGRTSTSAWPMSGRCSTWTPPCPRSATPRPFGCTWG